MTVARYSQLVDGDDREVHGGMLWLWCPGCQDLHAVNVVDPETGTRPTEGPVWGWDGDLEAPTIEGSILVYATRLRPRCHSFLQGGWWRFLGDCGHGLAGESDVPMESLPDWML